MSKANGYRYDIDGLRAIAVLSVIAFHLDNSLLPGGYVGVDIFFVLSGYLISLQIFRELSAQRFSLLEFYRRRIKRIAPAMLVVLGATLLAAPFWLLPDDASNVARSGLWALLSMANIYFWRFSDTDYFAAASEQQPLLHLWSLGIEEQFYIFWPLALIALGYARIASRRFIVVAVVTALLSFTAAHFLSPVDLLSSYYLLPTRAGELLLGALLAHPMAQRHFPAHKSLAAPCALLGLTLMIGSMFWLNAESVFPGFNAIPPTLGAALMLYAGSQQGVFSNRILTSTPARWIGQVSYSAYLWHWPPMAFYRYAYGEIDAAAGVIIVLFTFTAAWLSYRFIETPLRHSRTPAWPLIRRQFIYPAGGLILLSIAILSTDGFGLRQFSGYPAALAAQRAQSSPAFRAHYVCQRPEISIKDSKDSRCLIGAPDTELKVQTLLWGDSNASHYVGALSEIANTEGFRLRNLAISACPPLFSSPEPYVTAARLDRCQRSLEIARAASANYAHIILAGDWLSYNNRGPGFIDALKQTVQTLTNAGKRVTLLGKAPSIAGFDRLCEEKSISIPDLHCHRNNPLPSKITALNATLAKYAASSPQIHYVDFNELLCPDDICNSHNSAGQSQYYDGSHIALPASHAIGLRFIESGRMLREE